MVQINYTVNDEHQITGYTIVPFDPTLPWIEIENESDIHMGISTIINGEFHENREQWEQQLIEWQNASAIRNQIQSYKTRLQETDYQAIKFAEGQISAAEYEPMRVQRQEWRDIINELEQQLQN